jgi:hypothetical protein
VIENNQRGKIGTQRNAQNRITVLGFEIGGDKNNLAPQDEHRSEHAFGETGMASILCPVNRVGRH